MAIFHIELRQIKRQTAKGKIKKVSSIVAYRERIKIDNFDYSKKQDFIESFCLFPPKFQDSEYAQKLKIPEFFANEIEIIEKRKDSQLFDELIVALPHELNLDQNKEIITNLITEHYIYQNSQMARICIHQSKNNLHAHILLPQRPLESTKNGIKFGKKIRQEFNKFRQPKSTDKVHKIREDWANLVNSKLAEIGSTAKISHLSIKNRHAEALKNGDLEQAAKFDRPAFYLPATAYNPKFRLITAENDRFTPDWEKMEQTRKFYAKRHDLANYTWSDLIEERNFWQDLEEQGRLKIGVGLSAIRQMIRRFLRIRTTNNFTDSLNNDPGRTNTGFICSSRKNPATVFGIDQQNGYLSPLDILRTSRFINDSSKSEYEHSRSSDQATIPKSKASDAQNGRDEQSCKRLTRVDTLAINKFTNGINVLSNDREHKNRGIVFHHTIKRTPRRYIRQ